MISLIMELIRRKHPNTKIGYRKVSITFSLLIAAWISAYQEGFSETMPGV
jgi:hypothetical protein